MDIIMYVVAAVVAIYASTLAIIFHLRLRRIEEQIVMERVDVAHRRELDEDSAAHVSFAESVGVNGQLDRIEYWSSRASVKSVIRGLRL